jgi:hypothetical protein
MKLLVRIAVLALAAVGARSLYEKYAPRIQEARRTGNRLVDESVRPAVHDAAATIGDAASQAASTMGDAATQAASTLADASREVAEGVRDQASHDSGSDTGGVESTGPFGDPVSTGPDHPVSPLTAHELGVELSQ